VQGNWKTQQVALLCFENQSCEAAPVFLTRVFCSSALVTVRCVADFGYSLITTIFVSSGAAAGIARGRSIQVTLVDTCKQADTIGLLAPPEAAVSLRRIFRI
jgi:hypothetical protein